MHKKSYDALSVHRLLNCKYIGYIGMMSSLSIFFGISTISEVDKPLTFVNLCHEGSVIAVNINALNSHLLHGDVHLVDNDGDGFYTDGNDCGLPVDCDDDDATITSCGTIAVGSPHPSYGGIVFETDGLGGGKLVNCTAILGLNFGYVNVQHVTAWTSSVTDGFSNTDILFNVHANFDPIVAAHAKGPEWYLPSIEEVEIIYKEVFSAGPSPFSFGYYLSSTDAGSSRIWTYYFHLTDGGPVKYSHYGSGALTLSVRSF